MKIRRVIEIGCGDVAGPYWTSTEEHVIVDIDPTQVFSVENSGKGFRQFQADARKMPMFPDNSADIILARNVFGDEHLGDDYVDPSATTLLNPMNVPDDQYSVFAREKVDRKMAILHEGGRILNNGGQFIVFESTTPDVAEQFLSAAQPKSYAPLLEFESVDPQVIVPDEYYAANGRPGARTWVSYKQES